MDKDDLTVHILLNKDTNDYKIRKIDFGNNYNSFHISTDKYGLSIINDGSVLDIWCKLISVTIDNNSISFLHTDNNCLSIPLDKINDDFKIESF